MARIFNVSCLPRRTLPMKKHYTLLNRSKQQKRFLNHYVVNSKTVLVHYNSRHKRQRNPKTSNITCHKCGVSHLASVCRFKDQECHKCRKKKQFVKVCRSSQVTKAPMNQTKTHYVGEGCSNKVSEEQVDDKSYSMLQLEINQQNLSLLYVC